jgi:FKBP-type peptidyl-prolyl cis-trans isomerase (trigger factor)
VRRRLIEEIATANGIQAPRSLVHRLLRAYAEAYKVPEEQLDQFAAEFTPIAEAQVRRDLILDQVIRSEGLAATEAELDQRIAEIAKRRNQEPGEIYTSLQKAGRLKEIEQSLTEEKAFAHLLAQSTINDS